MSDSGHEVSVWGSEKTSKLFVDFTKRLIGSRQANPRLTGPAEETIFGRLVKRCFDIFVLFASSDKGLTDIPRGVEKREKIWDPKKEKQQTPKHPQNPIKDGNKGLLSHTDRGNTHSHNSPKKLSYICCILYSVYCTADVGSYTIYRVFR